MNNTNNSNNSNDQAFQSNNASQAQQPQSPQPAQAPPNRVMNDSKKNDPSLDAVRDILFGAQLKEAERKQDALENQIQSAIEVLRQETQQNFIAVAQDIDRLKDELHSETATRRDERAVTLKRFDTLEENLGQLKQQLNTLEQSLNTRVENESKRLQGQMNEWRNNMMLQMRTADDKLRAEKTDRAALAELFNKVADELSKKQ